MTMLPPANCAFKIPSVNDDLELSCRLYFPKQASTSNDAVSGFAIFAHPYAPLGGCYDDPIVQLTGSALLKQGFVLCTFNFRGAMDSSGSTSWTGRPELADYVSVYTFMLHLINAPEVIACTGLKDNKPLLLLGGYSYGSMIASHLPAIETVEASYRPSIEGSSDHEILSRAREISKTFLAYFQTRKRRERNHYQTEEVTSSVNSKHEIAMGGYEAEDAGRRIRRSSSHRSLDMDRIRHSVDRIRNRLSSKSDSTAIDQHDADHSLESINESPFAVQPQVAYLLISPLLQPVAGFTTIFSRLVFQRKGVAAVIDNQKDPSANLARNSTLAIYGDKDTFTSARRLRKWSFELGQVAGSEFVSKEISNAGHFWHEHGSQDQLLASIEHWVTSLIDCDPSRINR